MSQYVLLTIGKTHTGKSTFARDIEPQIPNSVILETDPLAVFLRNTVPKLHAYDLDHSGSFASPSLKFLLFRTMLEYALNQKMNVIMSNSNMYENGRKDVLELIKKYPAKTVGLYLNYPESFLSERIRTAGRPENVLVVSKDFNELLIKQRERFQPPNPNDFDYFFEVTDPSELPAVMTKVIGLYQ